MDSDIREYTCFINSSLSFTASIYSSSLRFMLGAPLDRSLNKPTPCLGTFAVNVPIGAMDEIILPISAVLLAAKPSAYDIFVALYRTVEFASMIMFEVTLPCRRALAVALFMRFAHRS